MSFFSVNQNHNPAYTRRDSLMTRQNSNVNKDSLKLKQNSIYANNDSIPAKQKPQEKDGYDYSVVLDGIMLNLNTSDKTSWSRNIFEKEDGTLMSQYTIKMVSEEGVEELWALPAQEISRQGVPKNLEENIKAGLTFENGVIKATKQK